MGETSCIRTVLRGSWLWVSGAPAPDGSASIAGELWQAGARWSSTRRSWYAPTEESIRRVREVLAEREAATDEAVAWEALMGQAEALSDDGSEDPEPLGEEDLAQVDAALQRELPGEEEREVEALQRDWHDTLRLTEQQEEDLRALRAALEEAESELLRVRNLAPEVEDEEPPLRTWTIDPRDLTQTHHDRLGARPEGALLLWLVRNARLKAPWIRRARAEVLSWLGTPGAQFPLTDGMVRRIQRKHDSLERARLKRQSRRLGERGSGAAFGDTWSRTQADWNDDRAAG